MTKNVNSEVKNLVDNLFRKEFGKIVSFLTSKFGFNFLDSAQDIAQDTLLSAFQNWSHKGIPENPEGWLFTVAKNKAINFIKKEKRNHEFLEYEFKTEEISSHRIILNKEIEDSMLKMIFSCCSELITVESQIILILSTLCGFSRKEIAHALVAEEEMVKKRLYRAKKKIREGKTSLEIPEIDVLKTRLFGVSNSLYLLFNEGYNSSSNDDLIRKDICVEALRLTQLLSGHFKEETRIKALLSLMCFHIARFESRIDDQGAIVLFKDQDRGAWNKELINKGIVELANASTGNEISSFHIEAGIALQHCTAKSYEETNWKKIKQLYTLLDNYKQSPVIKLNLSIVEGIMGNPKKAIEDLTKLKLQSKRLSKYYLLYASLAEFYLQLDNKELALKNFKIAKSLTSNAKEKKLLIKKENLLKKTLSPKL